MINEKLASHLSARLWIQKSKIEEVLGDFKEVPEPIVEIPVKHPIELVNEKYPNGWYCEAFDEVREDMAEVTGKALFTVKWYWCGWNPKESNNLGYLATLYNSYKYCYDTVITKSEYLSITRGVEEQTTIHTSKPCDIEERVKALEANKEMLYKILEEFGQRLESLENTPIVERKKRNLDIDTPTIDWKKVECLSWEDIMEVASICKGKSFASGYNDDRITLENFIKNKLKK